MSGEMDNLLFKALWVFEFGVLVYILIWGLLERRSVPSSGLWMFSALFVWLVQVVYLLYRVLTCGGVGCSEMRAIFDILAVLGVNLTLVLFLRRLPVKG